MATTRSSLVVVRVLLQGEPHLALVQVGRLGQQSLIAGVLPPGAPDWRQAAVRAGEQNLAPLRCGEDFELVQLTRLPLRWASWSITRAKTDHVAQVFALRFKREGCVARVASLHLVPERELADHRDSTVQAVRAALPELPLSWGGDPPVDATPPPAPRSPGNRASWTPEIIVRLGVDTDTQIAAELGISISAVAQRRRALGIARSPDAVLEPRQWAPDEDALLGTMPDTELGQKLGIPAGAVERRRVQLDILPYAMGRAHRKDLHELAGARYIDDYRAGVAIADIARKHGVDQTTVTHAIERYLARELAGSPR